MRCVVGSLACAIVCACAGACTQPPPPDNGHVTVTLQPPYSDLPAAPPGTAIEAGSRVTLDDRQQEAIAAGVSKWMKDTRTPQFGGMAATRNSRGFITVCGQVNGRNGAGAYAGMTPYVGVLIGTHANPEFIVVGIAGSVRERDDVEALCRDSGIAPVG